MSDAVTKTFAEVAAAGFKGSTETLDDYDIPRIGRIIGVGEDEVHAVIEVEAAGEPYDSKGRPKILFEPHVFYRNLSGTQRVAAVTAGLAYKDWKRDYPSDSYPRFIQALKINEAAAIKACSWGLGQILGENYVAAGYDSPQQMVIAMVEGGSEEHLEAMIRFIKSKHLDDELRAHNWSGFARGYNGAQYAKNGYHTKLAAAYKKWAKIPDTKWSPEIEAAYHARKTPPPAAEIAPAARVETATVSQDKVDKLDVVHASAPTPVVAPAATASISKPRQFLDLFMGKMPLPRMSPPPAAATPGDPTVYNVQTQLLAKGYNIVRVADGIMGNRTRQGMTLIQQDNGLPITDGKLTDEFLARLPGLPPRQFSEAQLTATQTQLKEQAPDVTKQLTGLKWAGGLTSLFSVFGGVQQSGMLDNIKDATEQATATAQSIQSLVTTLIGGVQWLIQHWWLFGVALGLYILLRAGWALLKLVVMLRQGRLL